MCHQTTTKFSLKNEKFKHTKEYVPLHFDRPAFQKLCYTVVLRKELIEKCIL
uniref:Uncharacterized protein n=1 Tax=Rhizophora mucronata TaxID=61149 RepID=A0A2P2N3P4_RHIMU